MQQTSKGEVVLNYGGDEADGRAAPARGVPRAVPQVTVMEVHVHGRHQVKRGVPEAAPAH